MSVLAFALGAALVSASDPARYRSASVDSTGRLHIVLQSGTEVTPPKVAKQVAFGSPAISPDGRTVGWLVLYAYPEYAYPEPAQPKYVGDPLPGLLVLYRNGRIIRRFRTEPVAYDWRFQTDGKQVAYCTGPTHGGAGECFQRAVDSGDITAYWRVNDQEPAPDWTRHLRR